MNRGVFKDLSTIEAYKQSDKEWITALEACKWFWHDQTVGPVDGFDTTAEIVADLRAFKRAVKENLDKRFVYFVASRKKVRFSRQQPWSFSPADGMLTFYVELGRDKALWKVTCRLQTSVADPQVRYTDKTITYFFEPKRVGTMSIHTFLANHDVRLNLASCVHYVGFTGNPHSRLISDEHRGLADTLRAVPDDENDFFHYYNLFKVVSFGTDPRGLRFLFANSMLDEVTVWDEGQLIEKAFIYYFKADQQALNRKRETSELKNRLLKLSRELKVHSVTLAAEMLDPSEYYRFYSPHVQESNRHKFRLSMQTGALELSALP